MSPLQTDKSPRYASNKETSFGIPNSSTSETANEPIHIPKVVCVLGIGPTENSAIIRLLDQIGIFGGLDNESRNAFRECSAKDDTSISTISFNSEIFQIFGGSFLKPPGFLPDWHYSPMLDDLKQRASKYLSDTFKNQPLWGIADPYLCYTIPLWRSILPPVSHIIIVRNPLDTAISLQRNYGLTFEASLLSWHTALNAALVNSKGFKRRFFFYDDILSHPHETQMQIANYIYDPVEISIEAQHKEINRFVNTEFEVDTTNFERQLHDQRIPFTINALYFALRSLFPFAATKHEPYLDLLEVFSEQSLQTQIQIDLILDTLISAQSDASSAQLVKNIDDHVHSHQDKNPRRSVSRSPQIAATPLGTDPTKNTEVCTSTGKKRIISDPKKSSALFDCFMLGLGSVGILAINRICAGHPDLFAPYWSEAFQILVSKNQIDLTNVPLKKVLMGHVWPASPENWHLVEKNTSPDLFIQFVRHPYEKALSEYNRAIFQAIIHNEPIPQIVSFFERSYQRSLLLQSAQATPFLPHFKKWEVIEFSQLLPDRIDTTSEYLWRLLGIDASWQSPIRKSRISNHFELFLYYSALKKSITIVGICIPISIIVSDGLPPHPQMTEEIGRLSTLGWDLVTDHYDGHQRHFIVLTEKAVWQELSWELKRYIRSESIVEEICKEKLLPELYEEYYTVKDRYDRLSLDNFPDATLQFLSNIVNEDLKKLIGKNQYVDEWRL